MPAWLTFLLRAIGLGMVVAVLLLILVPELRHSRNDISALLGQHKSNARVSFAEAINRAAPAVVNIYSVSVDKRPMLFRQRPIERTGLGSGVIMSSEGYILTCYHVIKGAENVSVQLQDGLPRDASIVGADPFTDLAVLKINGENLPVIPQLDDPQTRAGDLVLAIGNPFNLGQTITQGIVSATGRSRLNNGFINSSYADFIQMDAALNEGNSGGALVDSNGYLLGINNANFKTIDAQRQVKDVEGIYFAVPYDLAKRVMDDIITNGRVVRGYLGVSVTSYLNVPGVVVNEVDARGPAAAAGVQPGDMLVSIDGQAINDSDSYFKILDYITQLAPGTVVMLDINRQEKRLTVEVEVADLDKISR